METDQDGLYEWSCWAGHDWVATDPNGNIGYFMCDDVNGLPVYLNINSSVISEDLLRIKTMPYIYPDAGFSKSVKDIVKRNRNSAHILKFAKEITDLYRKGIYVYEWVDTRPAGYFELISPENTTCRRCVTDFGPTALAIGV